MDNPIQFASSIIRLSSYATVIVVSYFTIKNRLNRPKIFFIGDIIACVGLAVAIIAEVWFKYDLQGARIWIATPAVFIWSLTRIADFFGKESRNNLRAAKNTELEQKVEKLERQIGK